MEKEIFVVKRSGQKEKFDNKKIDKVVKWAVEGIEGVAAEDITKHFQFNYTSNGITTLQIHASLIESALDLISIYTPNYQFVAGKLLNYSIRKQVWGGKNAPRLLDLIKLNIKRGYYDERLLEQYSAKDINKINEFIVHERDLSFTHGGLNQMIKKYLVQNRETKEVAETPQFVYALVAMTLFSEEKNDRLSWVKKAYDYFSTFKINLATPVIAGCRSPLRSYASCALFSVDDTLDSIGAHDYLFKKASAARYGLGFNISNMRPLNAKIRSGDVLHTGLIPYLKSFETGIKSVHQNGLRGASGTVFINWWHYQVEEVISLKDNALPEEKAVRFLDYACCISKLFLDRVRSGGTITLFNPHEVLDLLNKFGETGWDELYIQKEQDPSIKSKKVIPAKQLMALLAKHRLETGRIYTFDIENANIHNPFKERVLQSNLCMEVTHPVIPSQKWNDTDASIGVCILSAINPYHIADDVEFESVCEVAVRMLDNLIDYQSYFDVAAKNFATKYRSLGIGLLNFAGFMAKNKVRYTDTEAPNFASRLTEKLSYYTIKASINLAKERGEFEYFNQTKWSDGVLPIDHYIKTIDTFVTEPLNLDWELLRKELLEHGIRNSTLTAMMPVESSAVVSGSTSSLEPIRDYIISKVSRAGKEISIAPDLLQNKDYYTLAFDLTENDHLLKIYAAVNKFIDMSISANTYVNVNHYENKQIPLSVIVETIFKASKWGLKSLYYNNTEDGSFQELGEDCAGGACKL
jgi:ribonucleoside-diphosphate reductase alpha chain